MARHDPDLARQMRRALGSAKETRACLDVATALGSVPTVDARVAAKLDSICAVLYRLVT